MNIANPRQIERKRRAAQIEGCGACTQEYITILRIQIMELQDELARAQEALEKTK